jgi:hypothetical protein
MGEETGWWRCEDNHGVANVTLGGLLFHFTSRVANLPENLPWPE